MADIKFTSSKKLIGEFLLDFDIETSSFINTFNRHIERAVQLLEINNYFVRCTKVEKIENESVPIPCEADYIEMIVVKFGDSLIPIDTDQSSILNSDIESKMNLKVDNNKTFKGYINIDRLIVHLDEGTKVGFVYKSVPKDKDGYLIIPDEGLVFEAINYFLIYKMALSGYKHKVINRKEAFELWRYYKPKATNHVTFPSVLEMQKITEQNNYPIKGDVYNNLFDL